MAERDTTDRLKADELIEILSAWAAWSDRANDAQRHMASEAAAMLDGVRQVCLEYEAAGFGDPGRAIDAVRDILGRRG